MSEEQQPNSEIHEIFQRFENSCVMDFAQGSEGNLAGIPRTVLVNERPKRLIKVEKSGEQQSRLMLPVLFTVKNDGIEYSAKTLDGELDWELLAKVFSALEQELRNALAKVPMNMYILNRKTQVTGKALDSTHSVPDAIKIIEDQNKVSGEKLDLLSTFLATLEQYQIFYKNLMPAFFKVSNLEGFNLDILHRLESQIDGLLLTVDFKKLTLGSEEMADYDDLFKKMSEQMAGIAEQYKGQPGVEEWFYKFLILAAFKRTYKKVLEFVIPQLEKIAPMLRLTPGDRLMHTDEDQPPTEYPGDDSPRDAH